jgi:serine protease Do
MAMTSRIRALAPIVVAALAVCSGCQPPTAAAAAPPDPIPRSEAPFATPPVLPGTPDIATLVAKVRPSVVNITTVQDVKVRGGTGMPDLDDLFPFFHQGPGGPNARPFGGGPRERGDRTMKQQALGSGFIVDSEGHVVTNAHVIDDADTVKVKLADDREFRAKVVGKDDRLDVAVLQLQGAPRDLPLAALGASDPLRVGEYVVAIGNPFGLGNTVTMGIVSAKGRTIGAGPYDDFIQTDASINPGNSGGPLFNLLGQVVGINTAINPQGKGIGFAIPVDAVKLVLPQLIATGHVTRGRLGVLIQGMDDDLAGALGLDHPHGALVEQVESGGPAERAGLKSGDLILAVDGQDIAHSEDLPRTIAPHKPGSSVRLTVLRDKKTKDVGVTLAALEDEKQSGQSGSSPSQGAPDPASTSALGVGVADESGHVVVEGVSPDGPAQGKLQPGDVIESVNQDPVANAKDLVAKIHAAPHDRPILLRIKRDDQSRFVAVPRR